MDNHSGIIQTSQDLDLLPIDLTPYNYFRKKRFVFLFVFFKCVKRISHSPRKLNTVVDPPWFSVQAALCEFFLWCTSRLFVKKSYDFLPFYLSVLHLKVFFRLIPEESLNLNEFLIDVRVRMVTIWTVRSQQQFPITNYSFSQKLIYHS